MKKNIVIVLLCLVLLCSCNSNSDSSNNSNETTKQSQTSSEVAMGRYIEEDTDFPSISVIRFIKTEEGFEAFGTNNEKLEWYKSSDGNTWSKQEAPWIDELNKESLWIRDISYDKDKNIYISIMSDKSLIKVVEDGSTVKDININWKNDFTYINSTYVLDNGDFLIIDVANGAMRYDKDGNFIMDYPFESYYDTVPSAVFENKLALEDNAESAIKIYNIDTGEVENNLSYKGLWDYDSILTFGKDGSLYIQNRLGIHRVAPNGSKFEELVDGSMTSMGMPSMTSSQIVVDNDEFWVAFHSSQLRHYIYSETTPSKPTQEIVMYMLNENTAMQQLAGEYQKSNPETKVTCNVSMDNTTGMTKSDIIRTLNTELLAGKGADLILLDGLPINSYIEKGVLMDLSDVDVSQLNSTVANTYKTNDKLYALPLYYKVPMMWADNDIINSVKNLDDLVNWKNTHTDKRLFISASYSDLIQTFYLTSAPYWLEDKTIDKDKFKQFLKNIKDLELLDEETEAQYETFITEIREAGEIELVDGFKSKNNIMSFAYNDFSLYLEKLTSPSSIMMPVAAVDKRGNSSFDSSIGQAESVYEPSTILAINNNSPNKDIAKEIINLAISEKVQDTKLYDLGLCVNNNSLEKMLTTNTDKYGSIGSSSRDSGRSLSANWPEEKYINRLKEVISKLKTPSESNEVLLQIILDETKGYFEDTKTLDEAVEAVSQRTQAYFTE